MGVMRSVKDLWEDAEDSEKKNWGVCIKVFG